MFSLLGQETTRRSTSAAAATPPSLVNHREGVPETVVEEEQEDQEDERQPQQQQQYPQGAAVEERRNKDTRTPTAVSATATTEGYVVVEQQEETTTFPSPPARPAPDGGDDGGQIPSRSARKNPPPPTKQHHQNQNQRVNQNDVAVQASSNDKDNNDKKSNEDKKKSTGKQHHQRGKNKVEEQEDHHLPLDIRQEDVECDFFMSPTLLSRLILFQKYQAASRRVHAFPQEAAIWICSKRVIEKNNSSSPKKNHAHDEPDKKDSISTLTTSSAAAAATATATATPSSKSYYTRRMLPIHLACECLTRMHHGPSIDNVGDNNNNPATTPAPSPREALEQLLSQLIFYYPEGCGRRDHYGRYPLHEAIWNHVSETVLGHMLLAAPHVRTEADGRGWNVLELNQNRLHATEQSKASVLKLLQRPPETWELARKEVELRLRHRSHQQQKQQQQQQLESFRSTSVVGDYEEDMTLGDDDDDDDMTPAVSNSPGINPHRPQQQHFLRRPPGGFATQQPQHAHGQQPQLQQGHKIQPVSWSQLEERSLVLEERLAQVGEWYFSTSQKLSLLATRHEELQRRHQALIQESDAVQQVETLQAENRRLREQVQRWQVYLRKHELPIPTNNNMATSSLEDDEKSTPTHVDVPTSNEEQQQKTGSALTTATTTEVPTTQDKQVRSTTLPAVAEKATAETQEEGGGDAKVVAVRENSDRATHASSIVEEEEDAESLAQRAKVLPVPARLRQQHPNQIFLDKHQSANSIMSTSSVSIRTTDMVANLDLNIRNLRNMVEGLALQQQREQQQQMQMQKQEQTQMQKEGDDQNREEEVQSDDVMVPLDADRPANKEESREVITNDQQAPDVTPSTLKENRELDPKAVHTTESGYEKIPLASTPGPEKIEPSTEPASAASPVDEAASEETTIVQNTLQSLPDVKEPMQMEDEAQAAPTPPPPPENPHQHQQTPPIASTLAQGHSDSVTHHETGQEESSVSDAELKAYQEGVPEEKLPPNFEEQEGSQSMEVDGSQVDFKDQEAARAESSLQHAWEAHDRDQETESTGQQGEVNVITTAAQAAEQVAGHPEASLLGTLVEEDRKPAAASTRRVTIQEPPHIDHSPSQKTSMENRKPTAAFATEPAHLNQPPAPPQSAWESYHMPHAPAQHTPYRESANPGTEPSQQSTAPMGAFPLDGDPQSLLTTQHYLQMLADMEARLKSIQMASTGQDANFGVPGLSFRPQPQARPDREQQGTTQQQAPSSRPGLGMSNLPMYAATSQSTISSMSTHQMDDLDEAAYLQKVLASTPLSQYDLFTARKESDHPAAGITPSGDKLQDDDEAWLYAVAQEKYGHLFNEDQLMNDEHMFNVLGQSDDESVKSTTTMDLTQPPAGMQGMGGLHSIAEVSDDDAMGYSGMDMAHL